MTWTVPVSLMQAAADLAEPIRQIARVQTVTAIGTVVLALLGIGIAALAFVLARRAGRTLAALERTVDRLAPRAEPLLEQAARVAEDAAEVSHAFRQDAERLHETVEELNERLREAARATEDRVRRFGAVARVVQEEFEEMLLDATATARGLHTTAEALRRPRPEGGRLREPGGRSEAE